MIKTFAVLVLAGALTAVASAAAAAGSHIERTANDFFWPEPVQMHSHRLPTRVQPLNYAIHLDFTKSPRRLNFYQGSVNITVEFKGPDSCKAMRCFNKLTHHIFSGRIESSSAAAGKDATPKCARPQGKRNQIVMHADKSVVIKSLRVFEMVDNFAGGMYKFLKIAKVGRDGQKQLIVLDMVAELPRTGALGLIEAIFEGNVREDKRGIYRSLSSYKEQQYVQVAAKFQPTFARLALPCFDEPAFKAKFSLSLTHDPKLQVYSNMDLSSQERLASQQNKVFSCFKTSPPMSIHMLAFTLGEYEPPLVLDVRANLRLRAIALPGKREAGSYALEVAKFALEWFENYIDYEFPLEKLDIVAFPDMDTDNTETWGLTFVKDIYALVDDETKPDSRITTAVNVAHVVVHQWFANLITAEWWDDMWITESVAAQMAFEIVDKLFPDQSEYFERIFTLSDVLASDFTRKNHSLSPPEYNLTRSDQVYELFDKIQFMKSGALARLVRDEIGYFEWRDILRKLVRQHRFESVRFSDLFGEISQSRNAPSNMLHRILTSWATIESYPIVNVAYLKSEHKLVLFEEAWHLAKTNLDHLNRPLSPWILPLKVLISDAEGARQVTKQLVLGAGLIEPLANRIDLPKWFAIGRDWVKVSPDPSLATYYRVRYSDELLRALKTPIEQRQLPPMDRLHLLNDARALAAGGLLGPETLEEQLGWHAHEADAAVIIEMLLSVRTLGSLATDSGPSRASPVFMDLYRRQEFGVSGQETLLEQRARELVLRALIEEGVPEVVEAAVRAYESTNGEVPLFLREPVYAAVVATGTEAQVRQLLDRLRRTESHQEQVRLASALSFSQNYEILTQTSICLIRSDVRESEQKPIRDRMLDTRIKINQSLQMKRINDSAIGSV